MASERPRSSSATTMVTAAARERLASSLPDTALDAAAENAVVNCLGVRAGDRVAIVTEPSSESIAAAILRAAEKAGATVEAFSIPAGAIAPGASDAFVGRLLARVDAVDVSFLVASLDGLPVELRRRMIAGTGATRRHGHLVGITRAMMEQSMRADYAEVGRLTERLVARLRPGATVEVRGPGGTELRVVLDASCRVWGASGVLKGPGWTNLPGGEVVAVPSSVDGILVPDGGVWMPEGAELATAFRLRLTFERGMLARIEGPADTAEQLRSALDAHTGARRVGQLGLGTNTGVIAPIGELLQDLKLPGAHLSLGHTCPEVTGARFDSDVEVPLLVRRASVTIDGTPVLVNGRYPRELLA